MRPAPVHFIQVNTPLREPSPAIEGPRQTTEQKSGVRACAGQTPGRKSITEFSLRFVRLDGQTGLCRTLDLETKCLREES